jgi:hypothetical protein
MELNYYSIQRDKIYAISEINHETHYVLKKDKNAPINKGNKKFTELQTKKRIVIICLRFFFFAFTDYNKMLYSYFLEIVLTFLRGKWILSCKNFSVAPNLSLSLRLNGSGCHYNSIYNNTGTKYEHCIDIEFDIR